MKGTETFKQVIKDYLETKAKNDELFAPVYNKPNKNIVTGKQIGRAHV